MSETARAISPETNEMVTRFSVSQRGQHLVVMISFTLLMLTGLPQKFYDQFWAQAIITFLGGIDLARQIHHISAWVFAVSAGYHLVESLYLMFVHHSPFSMSPTLKDFSDAIVTLRYSLGLSSRQVRSDRYDYRQKFEYWGIVFGALIIGISGMILLFATQVTAILPGVVVAAAREFHSNEALLAFLTIITWHLYGAHFGPERFPGDSSIFTGQIPKERMREEHPLEYARVFEENPAEVAAETAPGPSPRGDEQSV